MYTFCLFCPQYPALAARYALRVAEVVVQSKGKVLALTSGLHNTGVEAGMSVDRAARLLENVPIVERDAAREAAVWDAILERLFEITPLLVSTHIGEAYCSMDDRRAIGLLLQDLQAQGGIAQTRMLAKLAAVYAAPGRLTLVEQESIPRFLGAWKVEHLLALDFEPEFVEKLQLFGLTSLTHLQHLTRRHLHVQFGDEGVRLHQLIRQIPVRSALSLYNPPPMIVERMTFESRQREPVMLEAMLNEVINKACAVLQQQCVSTLEVGMLDRDGHVACRQTRILKKPLTQHSILHTTATILLREMMSPHRWCHGIEVKFKGLSAVPTEQLPLFERRPSIDTVGRSVARRFPHALVRVEHIIHDAYLPEETFRLVRYENPARSD